MKQYTIKQASSAIYSVSLVLFFIFLLVYAIVLSDLMFGDDIFLNTIFLGIILVLGFYAINRISISIIEITVDDFGLSKTWIRQFPFQNRPNTKIEWEKILEYQFEPDSNWCRFKMTATSGEFNLLHNNNSTDDFYEFLFDFEERINTINENERDIKSGNKIARSPNRYEGKSGIILATFAIAFIFVTFILIPRINFTAKNMVMLISIWFSLSYILIQVYKHRKKV